MGSDRWALRACGEGPGWVLRFTDLMFLLLFFSALARHQRKRVEKIYGAQIISVPTVQPKLPVLHGATAMRRPLARTRVMQGISPASELSGGCLARGCASFDGACPGCLALERFSFSFPQPYRLARRCNSTEYSPHQHHAEQVVNPPGPASRQRFVE